MVHPDERAAFDLMVVSAAARPGLTHTLRARVRHKDGCYRLVEGTCTDLRADGCASVHDERNQDVHIALNCMGESSITGRDNDLKQIRAHRQVSGNPEHINHRRHPDVTSASAEKAPEHSAHERNQENHPERNRFHAGCGKSNHRPNLHPLDRTRRGPEGRFVPLRNCTFYFFFG